MILDPLQLLIGAGAFLALLRELLGDSVKLSGDILVHFILAHLEVVLLLQANEHVAEVVADEVFEEGVDIVSGIDIVLFHDLIGEIGTGLEGQTLRLAEGVVTVEEDVFDLQQQ